ncbi:MAG: rhodanese-like domain-containing protein [Rhodospirillaceae bacterium]|jgi:rhodanese-related sulfurtransferase
MAEQDYAGDILPKEAWQMLSEDLDTVLVDVRTPEEWQFVGVPDLHSIDKDAILVAWRQFGAEGPDPEFESKVRAHGIPEDKLVLFLCRSGQRSKAAAVAMTAAGFKKCYNVATGFEGDLDDSHHRNAKNGWRVDGLPWKQT